jgi:molybdopterin-guanine dinucleotide biosynthesis protein A
MAGVRCTGVLLVGGASTRFGSPKALARFKGETLAERAWRVLGEACDERLAFGKGELSLPFPVLDDGLEQRAPIAGVVAGLRAAEHDVCVFLPVDVPLIEAETLRRLAAHCPAVNQRGPLPGAFARDALPVLERRLAAGLLALHEAAADLDAAVLDVDEAELANVNSPADLAALESRRAARGGPSHRGAEI